MASDVEPFSRQTIVTGRDLILCAVMGDRASFDRQLSALRAGGENGCVAVTVFALYLTQSVLAERRSVLTSMVLTIERWALWPIHRRRPGAYTDYLAPLDAHRRDQIADSVLAGVFGDLISPTIFRALLDGPWVALDSQRADRHDPRFTPTALHSAAALLTTSTRSGRPEQVNTLITVLGSVAWMKGGGPTRSALANGFGGNET